MIFFSWIGIFLSWIKFFLSWIKIFFLSWIEIFYLELNFFILNWNSFILNKISLSWIEIFFFLNWNFFLSWIEILSLALLSPSLFYNHSNMLTIVVYFNWKVKSQELTPKHSMKKIFPNHFCIYCIVVNFYEIFLFEWVFVLVLTIFFQV